MTRRHRLNLGRVVVLLSSLSWFAACTSFLDTERQFDRSRGAGGTTADSGRSDAAPSGGRPDAPLPEAGNGGGDAGPLRAEPLGQHHSETGGQDAFGIPVAFAGDLLVVASAGLSTVRGGTVETPLAGGALLFDTASSPLALRGTFFSPQPQIGGGACSGVDFAPLPGVSPPCVGVATEGTTFVLGLGNQNVTVEGTTILGAGAVYVFEQGDAGAWSLVQELTAETFAHQNAAFGFGVALSGDLLAVSAPWDDGAAVDAGAVYTFRRRAGTYVRDTVVHPDLPMKDDLFGIALAVEGDLLVASAPLETGSGQGVAADPTARDSAYAGAVYAFELQEGSYRQEAYLKPTEPPASKLFGSSLALAGSTLAVGAPGFPEGSGVYVYERATDGWHAVGNALRPANYEPSSFGSSVALDGNLLVVGAPNDRSSAPGVRPEPLDTPADTQQASGAAHVFERTPLGFTYSAYLKTEAPRSLDLFGASVAVSGNVVAVGAPAGGRTMGSTGLRSGAVHLFRYLPLD